MQQVWNLAMNTSEFLSSRPSTAAASQTPDKVLETADVRALLEERSWNCSKLLLDCMMGLGHSGPEYNGLLWIILLIVAGLLILVIPLTICAWRTSRTRKRTVSRRREDGSHESEMPLAGQSEVQQPEDCVASGTSDALNDDQCMEELQKEKIVELEERILKMECNQASLEDENVQLQKLNQTLQKTCKTQQENYKTLQGKYEILQENYETQQEKHKTRQGKYEILQRNYENQQEKHKTLQGKYEILQENYETQQEKHKTLQGKYEILQRNYETQQEKHKTLQGKYEILQGNYETLQEKYETLQEKCQVLQNQDQAEQRRCVEEQHVMEFTTAEPEEDVRRYEQMIQEMHEVASHKKTPNSVVAPAAEQAHELRRKELACQTKKRPEVSAKVLGSRQPLDKVCSSLPSQQIRHQRKCCGVSKKTTETIDTNDKSIHVESMDQLGRHQCESALVAGRIKANHREEKIRAQVKNYEALRKDKVMLERQVQCLLEELRKMSKKCQEKEQDLLRKVAQVKSEREGKELKVKEVFQLQKEIQAIKKQYQKAESSYKAEIAALKRAQDKLMKTCPLHCAVLRKQMTTEVKLSNATKKEQNIPLDTIQSARRTTQDLEDPEDVSHLSQIEVLPPGIYTPSSEAGTSSSSAPGTLCSFLENLATSGKKAAGSLGFSAVHGE